MRVFVTGASGFVGRAVVGELLGGGHQVLGLARSDVAARVLHQLGAEVQAGSISDHDGLREGAQRADAVIHLAFEHDFSKFVEGCEADRLVIESIAAALVGSRKPFLVPNGMAGLTAPGQMLTERDDVPPDGFLRSGSKPLPRLRRKGLEAEIATEGDL